MALDRSSRSAAPLPQLLLLLPHSVQAEASAPGQLDSNEKGNRIKKSDLTTRVTRREISISAAPAQTPLAAGCRLSRQPSRLRRCRGRNVERVQRQIVTVGREPIWKNEMI